MAVDLRNQLLNANDIKVQPLDIPAWGGTYYLRVISGKAREHFEESYSQEKMKNFRLRFLVLTLCDEAGKPILSDADMDALGERSSVEINRVFDAAWKLNAFTQEAVDALGEGLQNAPSDDSSSG
jgi:hypothetical protein